MLGTTNGRDNTRSQKAAFRVQNKSSTKRHSMPVKTDRRIEVEEEKWSDQGPAGLRERERQRGRADVGEKRKPQNNNKAEKVRTE